MDVTVVIIIMIAGKPAIDYNISKLPKTKKFLDQKGKGGRGEGGWGQRKGEYG